MDSTNHIQVKNTKHTEGKNACQIQKEYAHWNGMNKCHSMESKVILKFNLLLFKKNMEMSPLSRPYRENKKQPMNKTSCQRVTKSTRGSILRQVHWCYRMNSSTGCRKQTEE